jgi:endonuclease-3
MSESLEVKKARVAELIREFGKTYPNAHCELNYRNPLELLVATILSAQCTDRRVNIVTADLFKKYRTAADYAAARPQDLENEIRSTGFYKNKTKSIQAACRTIQEKFAGKVPDTMDQLLELAGVGRKTANVILGNAFGKSEGIVVDTHVTRLAARLVLTRHSDPVKIEADLMKLVPRGKWTIWSHWLIWHGRRRCMARNPDCPGCEVRPLCPTGRVKTSRRAGRQPMAV